MCETEYTKKRKDTIMIISTDYRNEKFSKSLAFSCDIRKKTAGYVVSSTINGVYTTREFNDGHFDIAVEYFNMLPMTPEEVEAMKDKNL